MRSSTSQWHIWKSTGDKRTLCDRLVRESMVQKINDYPAQNWKQAFSLEYAAAWFGSQMKQIAVWLKLLQISCENRFFNGSLWFRQVRACVKIPPRHGLILLVEVRCHRAVKNGMFYFVIAIFAFAKDGSVEQVLSNTIKRNECHSVMTKLKRVIV